MIFFNSPIKKNGTALTWQHHSITRRKNRKKNTAEHVEQFVNCFVNKLWLCGQFELFIILKNGIHIYKVLFNMRFHHFELGGGKKSGKSTCC